MSTLDQVIQQSVIANSKKSVRELCELTQSDFGFSRVNIKIIKYVEGSCLGGEKINGPLY